MAFHTDRVHARHARDAVLGNYGQALELPSYGAPADWRLEIVEAVAYWAERGLVVPAVGRDGAGRALDRGGRLGQRDDRPALQQPDQSDLVVSRQAAVARVRRRRRRWRPNRSRAVQPSASACSPQAARKRRPSSMACRQRPRDEIRAAAPQGAKEAK